MENNLQFRPPSDSELVMKLLKFVAGKSFPETEIAFADVYSKQPWQLIGECSKKTHYFFTQLKKKKSTDSRFKRTMGDGSWTQQDKGKPILDEDENLVIGYKRSLSYKNRKDSSLNGRWMMKEYFLADFLLNELKSKNNEAKDFVICAIKKNPRSQVKGNNVPSDDVNEYKKFIARVLQESVNVQPLFSEQSMVSETPSASYDVNQTYSNDLFVENREFYEEGDWISLLDFADDDLVPKNCLLSNSGELMAVWGGVKLADVLELVGIPYLTSVTKSGGKHVEFVSIDKCKEENGGPYTNPEADVLLAYEMNGETLNRDHGYPLRVVVPGVIGARSVKWLDSINIIAEECQGFFMQKDYKTFPPTVNRDNINWSTRRPQMDFPVQCAICSLEDVSVVKHGKITIKGYAVSGWGRGIERVDISIDGGKTWVEATRYQRTGIPYIADHSTSDKWAWVFFEAEANIPQSAEIVAKAVDISANVQPESIDSIWNLRGILNTSWHRVQVRVG